MEHKFTCEKCQKTYSSSQSLCNHRRIKHRLPNEAVLEASEAILADKKSVSINNLLICHYCDKKYSHRQSRYKHEKKCLKNTSLIKLENNSVTENQNQNKNQIVNGTLNNGAINNGTINGTLNNGTINNITINNFNADNTEYFSDKFKNKILNYFKNNDKFHLPVPNVVQNLKFNPNHKENNNMKITNMKNKVGQKYENNKWIYCKKNDIFNDAHKMAVKMIEEWINEKPTDSKQDILDGFNDYLKVNRNYIKKVIFEEINQLGYVYYKNYMDNQLDD